MNALTLRPDAPVTPAAHGTTPTSSATVLLVDDHALMRKGVRTVLDATDGLQVLSDVGTAADCLRAVDQLAPDIVIVDVRLPDGDGIDLVREIGKRSEARCIVLTSSESEEVFYQAVVAGAVGFVVKDVAPGKLAASVRSVARGRRLISEEQIDELRRRREALPEHELLATLSAQERKVLELLAVGATNREIAGQLFLAEKTVRNYVSNVLAKLNMSNRTQLAAWVTRLRARQDADVLG